MDRPFLSTFDSFGPSTLSRKTVNYDLCPLSFWTWLKWPPSWAQDHSPLTFDRTLNKNAAMAEWRWNWTKHNWFHCDSISWFFPSTLICNSGQINKKCEVWFQSCFRCFTSTRKIIFWKRNRHLGSTIFWNRSNHWNVTPYKQTWKYQKCFKLNLETIKIALISSRIKCEYLNATNRDQKDNIFATNNWYLGYDKCT